MEEVRNKINAMAIKIFLVIYVIFCSVISHTSIICVYIYSLCIVHRVLVSVFVLPVLTIIVLSPIITRIVFFFIIH